MIQVTTKRMDVYQQVTDRIVAALEQGTAPWVRPWSQGIQKGPVNYVTGRPYRGINVFLLGHADRWMTYRQAQAAGLQVRGGEKGTLCVFWKFLDDRSPNAKPGSKVPLLRHYNLFHTGQVEGEVKPLPGLEAVKHEPFAPVEHMVARHEVSLGHGGDKAFFSPELDHVQMPDRTRFESQQAYYATLLHELTHWTGHEHRLARPITNAFRSPEYAREELVAELGSAFLCASLGIDGQLRHAEYLGSWINVLKEDKRAIIQVSSAAQKAADYLLGEKPEVEDEGEEGS